MEDNQMFRVTMGQTARDYPAGTTFQTIADQVQGDYPHDVLLVNRNGKLCELHKKLDRDCALTMVTAADRPGMQTYERTALLLLLKAFYDTVGRDKIRRVRVEYLPEPRPVPACDGGLYPGQGPAGAGRGPNAGAGGRENAHRQAVYEHGRRGGAAAGYGHGGQGPAAELPHQLPGEPVHAWADFTDYFYGYMAPGRRLS